MQWEGLSLPPIMVTMADSKSIEISVQVSASTVVVTRNVIRVPSPKIYVFPLLVSRAVRCQASSADTKLSLSK